MQWLMFMSLAEEKVLAVPRQKIDEACKKFDIEFPIQLAGVNNRGLFSLVSTILDLEVQKSKKLLAAKNKEGKTVMTYSKEDHKLVAMDPEVESLIEYYRDSVQKLQIIRAVSQYLRYTCGALMLKKTDGIYIIPDYNVGKKIKDFMSYLGFSTVKFLKLDTSNEETQKVIDELIDKEISRREKLLKNTGKYKSEKWRRWYKQSLEEFKKRYRRH